MNKDKLVNELDEYLPNVIWSNELGTIADFIISREKKLLEPLIEVINDKYAQENDAIICRVFRNAIEQVLKEAQDE